MFQHLSCLFRVYWEKHYIEKLFSMMLFVNHFKYIDFKLIQREWHFLLFFNIYNVSVIALMMCRLECFKFLWVTYVNWRFLKYQLVVSFHLYVSNVSAEPFISSKKSMWKNTHTWKDEPDTFYLKRWNPYE